MNRFLCICTSVASALLLCNLAYAEDEGAITDGIRVGGYASGNLNLHPGGLVEASASEASLFLSWEGTGRWRLFSELEVENLLHWREGASLSTHKADFDVERLYADYVYSERATLRMGRFLTPVGRWNLIHADPLVWTTRRPLATERLFSLNVNGIMLQGVLPLGAGALEYSVYSEAVHDMHHGNDEIPFEKTRGARLAFSGPAEVGLSLLDFREETLGNPHYRMLGLDFSAGHGGWEASGEVFRRFRVGESNGSPDAGSGGYLQGVAPLGARWFAVGRLEAMQRPAEASIQRWLVGAAWRIDEKRVLKLDYMGGNAERPEAPKGMFASFAVLF
jgi:hypothetical protein